MNKAYADLHNGYIKLYKEKPTVTMGHEVWEVELPDGPDSRVFVGLSIAWITGATGYGLDFSKSLEEIRERKDDRLSRACDNLASKIDACNEDIKTKHYEYLLSVTE